MTPYLLIIMLVLVTALAVATRSSASGPKLTVRISETTVRLWNCQDRLVLLGFRKQRDGFQEPRDTWGQRYAAWVLEQRARKLAKCQATLRYVVAHLIPDIHDWLGAVQWVQRIYPGTERWLRDISDREGGWREWVWYGGRGWTGYHIGDDYLGADTVGGWMQFRYSTFAPYWRQAQQWLEARGYIVPRFKMPAPGGNPKYAAWLAPMGQALTAGYMRYTGRDGCHWCL